jgi:CSLREA domain-containing protein
MKFKISLIVLFLSHLYYSMAFANIITVNTTDDIIADDGFCSLREAVESTRISSASGDLLGECIAGDVNSVDTLNFQLVFPALIALESALPIANWQC